LEYFLGSIPVFLGNIGIIFPRKSSRKFPGNFLGNFLENMEIYFQNRKYSRNIPCFPRKYISLHNP
jgi:hypothetical protein